MKITKDLFKKNTLLNIEELFLLWALGLNHTWWGEVSLWPSSWYKLRQLDFVEGEKITKLGLEYLSKLGLYTDTNKDTVTEKFNAWWKNYPSYDDHGQWGRTRRIKTNKIRSQQLYKALIEEGVDSKLLLNAVTSAVEFEKKNSVKENKLKYFPNPARWLFQRDFEAYEEAESEDDNTNYVEYGKEIG